MRSAGITPAWAGKSFEVNEDPNKTKDHPRVGGEKAARFLSAVLQAGITPAWAGKRGGT